MKRLLCFLLILLALSAFVGCSKKQTDYNPLLGTWEADTEMSILGVSLPDDGKQSISVVYRLEFYADGTGKSSILVDEKYLDRIPNINTNFTYVHDGDKLTLTHEEGNTQVFTVSFSDGNMILDGRTHIELIRKK